MIELGEVIITIITITIHGEVSIWDVYLCLINWIVMKAVIGITLSRCTMYSTCMYSILSSVQLLRPHTSIIDWLFPFTTRVYPTPQTVSSDMYMYLQCYNNHWQMRGGGSQPASILRSLPSRNRSAILTYKRKHACQRICD